MSTCFSTEEMIQVEEEESRETWRLHQRKELLDCGWSLLQLLSRLHLEAIKRIKITKMIMTILETLVITQ